MRVRSLLAGLLVVLATACNSGSSGGGGDTTPPPTPDFSLSVGAPSPIQAGASGSVTANLTRSGGHSAAVTLSLATNGQGITGSGSIGTGAASGSLALSVPLSLSPGTYSLTVSGSDGSLTRSATFSLTVTAPPDFSLALAAPPSIQAGAAGFTTATLTRSGGHSAAVTLSLASNAQGITGSGSVPAGGSTGNLMISVPLAVSGGTYGLTANASDGSLSRSVGFSLTVTPAPDYSFTVTPPAGIMTGASGNATVTVLRTGGHAAPLSLGLASNPQGITGSGSVGAASSGGTLTLNVPAGVTAGTYTLSASATDGSLVRNASFSLVVTAVPNYSLSVVAPPTLQAGNSGATTVNAARVGGHNAVIALGIASNPQGISGSGSIASGSNSGNLGINVPGAVGSGTYTLTVSGTDGSLARTATFSLTVTSSPTPDFSLSVAPPPSIPAGNSGSTTINVTRIAGHALSLGLGIASNAQGITGSGAVGTGASSGTLTITVPVSVAAGSYPLSATATDGTLNRSASFSLTVTPAGSVTYTIPSLYITQATQTQAFNVPLVKDRDGYLRAFVVASGVNSATPSLLVEIKNGATTVFSSTIPAPGASVPTAVDESSLTKSWNVAVPAAALQPSYTLKATLSAGGVTWPASGTPQTLDVRSLNPFRVTFLAVHTTDGLTGGGGTLNATYGGYPALLQKIWPVPNGVDAIYGGVLNSSVATLLSDGTGWGTVLSEVLAKRTSDGVTNRYYYGVVNPNYSGGVAGLGYLGTPAAIGWDKFAGYGDSGQYPGVYAHETGHNFNLNHAPCGGAGGPDPSYPYTGGKIGVWGTDVSVPALKDPAVWTDIMGYCSSVWVSDYNYKKVLANRQGGSVPIAPPGPEDRTTPRSLLLWGRLDDGVATLEPAFHMAVDAQPPEPGDQLLEGFDAAGRRLFSVSFGLVEVGCLDPGRGRHFAFSLPLSAAQAARLSELRWTKAGEILARQVGPAERPLASRTEPLLQPVFDGHTRLLWDAGAEPMVMVRDGATGSVLGFGRRGDFSFLAEAPKLELHFSNGVTSRVMLLDRPAFGR